MTGYTFESFRVSEENREATEVCRLIGEGRYHGESPVVLVGPAGSGKSHLLWSIVKRLRAHDPRAGLALVLAREFPEKVRRLADHPGPIQNGRAAVLLVDELELFEEGQSDLEDVVRVFLQNGHPVVLASRVHPADLGRFPESFRVLLSLGRILSLGGTGTAGTGTEAVKDTQLAEELAALRAERDMLEQRLAEKARQLAQLESVRADLAALTQERDRLLLSAADTSAIDALQREHAAAVAELRAEIAALSAERDRACAERDALERQLAERARQEQAALSQMQGQRESLAMALEEARLEKAALEAAAGHALSRVETMRAKAAAAQEALYARLERLEEMSASGGVALEEARRLEGALAAARAELESLAARRREEQAAADALHRSLRTDLEEAQRELAARVAELRRAEEELAEERQERRESEFELSKARRQVALAMVELDALRHEAASQVAHAQLALGEREARLGELSEALELARHAGRAAALEARTLQEELHRMADALDALSARLGVFDGLLPTTREAEAEEMRRTEPILFDPSVIRSAAETLHELTRELAQDPATGADLDRGAAAGGT